jgi:hypothetical protein
MHMIRSEQPFFNSALFPFCQTSKYFAQMLSRIGGIKAIFLNMPSHLKILGLLISSIYVNFPEFMSIFKRILLQMRRGNREKVQAFSVSMNSRIAGSGFGLEVSRVGRAVDIKPQIGRRGNSAEEVPIFKMGCNSSFRLVEYNDSLTHNSAHVSMPRLLIPYRKLWSF